MREIDIRAATAADAPFLARIALIASRAHVGWGFYDIWFPGTDDQHLQRLTRTVTTKARWFHHYSMRAIACVDGVPAGSIAGFPATAAFWVELGKAMNEALSPGDLASLAERRAATDTCVMTHTDGAWGIELVGVLPEFRSRGVADALLRGVLARGRDEGHSLASVIFESGNDPAQRACGRGGFAVVEERRHADFEGVMRTPGLRRAETPL